MTTQPVALYRHFDARGELLYVGITDDPARRWLQHVESSAWSVFVATSYLTGLACREEAAAAERIAIRTEQPIFNVARSGRRAAARVRARYLTTGSSGLPRRVPCRWVPGEFCVTCGPDSEMAVSA